MTSKPKHLALIIVFIGLLTTPAGADEHLGDPTADVRAPHHPGLLLAGGSSLVATSGQEAAPSPESPSPAPELVVTEPLHDFGRVLDGTEIVHDFLIENRGAGDLAIDQVRTG
jgi:hypothetical protein